MLLYYSGKITNVAIVTKRDLHIFRWEKKKKKNIAITGKMLHIFWWKKGKIL